MKRRLLTISHSYSVTSNRRLAHELAVAGGGQWEVTAVAPIEFPGDLGPVHTVPDPGERSSLVPVPMRLGRHPHIMWYGRELRALLKQHWDLVHCWEEPYVVAGAQVARWVQPDARLVYATFQNIDKRYPPPFGTLEHYSMSRAAGWIAFGRTVESTLASRRGYVGLPHRVISPGVDVQRFAAGSTVASSMRRTLGWDDSSIPAIGYLGRFVPEKGLELLMRALDRVRHPWRALFVGGGPLEGQLRAWGAHRPDSVRVVTAVPHADVPRHLAAMDVLCAPSLTTPRWREQFGRMLIEAFAAGVPVLGSDSGEVPYVIGDAGRIVREGDERAWAAAIDEVLADATMRAGLRARGLARAHAEFAWPVIARRHLDIFESVLAAPARRADGGRP